jgi:hypothetical protein
LSTHLLGHRPPLCAGGRHGQGRQHDAQPVPLRAAAIARLVRHARDAAAAHVVDLLLWRRLLASARAMTGAGDAGGGGAGSGQPRPTKSQRPVVQRRKPRGRAVAEFESLPSTVVGEGVVGVKGAGSPRVLRKHGASMAAAVSLTTTPSLGASPRPTSARSGQHRSQKICPHPRQWCRRRITVKAGAAHRRSAIHLTLVARPTRRTSEIPVKTDAHRQSRQIRVRGEIMRSIIIRTDSDSPTFLHIGAPIISTRTRIMRVHAPPQREALLQRAAARSCCHQHCATGASPPPRPSTGPGPGPGPGRSCRTVAILNISSVKTRTGVT